MAVFSQCFLGVTVCECVCESVYFGFFCVSGFCYKENQNRLRQNVYALFSQLRGPRARVSAVLSHTTRGTTHITTLFFQKVYTTDSTLCSVCKGLFRTLPRSDIIRWPKRGQTAASRRRGQRSGWRAAARGLSWRRQRAKAAALCAAGGGSASDSRTSVLPSAGLARPPAGLALRGRGWRAARDSPAGHGRAVARATPPSRARRG